MSLLKKSVSGLIWSTINTLGFYVINLIVQIILARILSPEDFGVMATIQVFLVIGMFLMDGGMTSSLIRMKKPTEEDFSTVFFTNITFSLIFYSICFFIAPYVAVFYNKEIIEDLIKVVSLSFVIRSFGAVQAAVLTKKMQFKKQFYIQIPSIIIGGAVGIILGLYGVGVWSLVFFNVAQSITYSIVYWLLSGWKPKLIFKKDLFLYHFNFGYKISLTNIFNGLFDNIYNMVIGKVYSLQMLSYYNRAETFQFLPGRVMSGTLEKVTYPMFAEIQDDDLKLNKSYRTILLQAFYAHTPILIFISIFAEPIFRFVLTEKWLPMVPYFRVLLIAGIFNPLQRFNLNILRVKNKPSQILYLNVFKKVLVALAILCTFKFDLIYMVTVQSITYVFSFLIISHYVGKLISYDLYTLFRDFLPIVMLNILWGGLLVGLLVVFNSVFNDILLILSMSMVAIVLYFLLSKLLKIEQIDEALKIIKKGYKK